MSDTPVYDSVGDTPDLSEEQLYRQSLKAKLNDEYGKVSPEENEANRLAWKTAQAMYLDELKTYADSDSLATTDAPKWFTIGRRKWAYNVAIAVLLIVTGWQGAAAVTFESWANLLTAVLSLGATGTQILARVNVR